MSDRAHIGLDNPAFRGRLRQPQGLAQSLRVSSAARPSARYYQQSISAPQNKPKPTVTTPSVPASVAVPVAVHSSVPVAVAAPRSLEQRRHRSPAFGKTYDNSFIQSKQQHQSAPAAARQPQRSQVLSRQTLYEQATASQAHGIPKKRTLFHPGIRLRGYTKLQYSLVTMSVLIFAIGIGVSVMTLQTNKLTTSKVAALAKQSTNAPATSDAAGAAGAGTPPSTVRPSAASISNYAVGPNMPRYLNIPKYNVHARVLSLGILTSGALATPNNVYDTGWYNQSSLPGQPGAMLFDGHVSSWTTNGVFYHLKDLVGGDVVQVVRGDGTTFDYKVVKNHFFDHNDVDMKSSVLPVYADKPGLNLITCSGDVIRGTNEFQKRVIVYAAQL
jgi:sortase (surface protein transpeptidase)